MSFRACVNASATVARSGLPAESKPEEVLVNLPVDFAKLPTPDVLADFDAINQLRQAAVTTDDQLLEALQ